jgi:hypothetical protein
MHILANEFQLRIAHQDAGQQARFAQDLKAVADPEHETAIGGVFAHRVHHRRAGGNRAAAQIVAIGKPAGHHDEVGPLGSAVSACQTIAASLPETSFSARAMSRSRLIPGKTRTADFMALPGFGRWNGRRWPR